MLTLEIQMDNTIQDKSIDQIEKLMKEKGITRKGVDDFMRKYCNDNKKNQFIGVYIKQNRVAKNRKFDQISIKRLIKSWLKVSQESDIKIVEFDDIKLVYSTKGAILNKKINKCKFLNEKIGKPIRGDVFIYKEMGNFTMKDFNKLYE
jgi:hypothetical protein